MLKGDSPEAHMDMGLQAYTTKNPLKVVLSEGHTVKKLPSVVSSVVGGTGFEPATSTV